MLTLYLIRHGQSEANSKGIIQGHAEFPLSDLGVKQAELAGKWMAEVPLHAIYTSDLTRARKTAEKIAVHHPYEPEPWEMVREVGLGPLEGKTREQMYKEFPGLQADALLTSGIEGTESTDNITRRCAHVVEKLSRIHKDNTAAVVSHGGFIGIFLMYLIAGDEWHKLSRPFVIGNTGITKVTIEDSGKAKLHFTNRTDHLEQEKEEMHTSAVVY